MSNIDTTISNAYISSASLIIPVIFYPNQVKPLLNTIVIMFSISFPILSKYFFIKLYTDLNSLWVKHATHQKDETLRAASLSRLDYTASNKSVSNTKYAEFFIK